MNSKPEQRCEGQWKPGFSLSENGVTNESSAGLKLEILV